MTYHLLPGYPWIGGSARHISPNPSDDACFNVIKEWIQTCDDGHVSCKSRSTGYLPKRVVYVGQKEDFSDVSLFEGQNEAGRYTALSHCWGSGKHLLTTKNSISQLKHKIPWIELSQTFQDAIIINRKLQIDYLWIDSLCIVQDDAQDWEEESAKMGTIYQEAYLVISATLSSTGSQGCFRERQPVFELQGVESNGQTFSVFSRASQDHDVYNWSRTETISADLSNYPTLTRGWCYQERLLAPRVLHYTSNELIWECLEATNCECGALWQYGGDPMLLQRRFACGLSSDDFPGGEKEWRDMVASYISKHQGGAGTFEELQLSSDFLLHQARLLQKDVAKAHFLALKFSGRKTDPSDDMIKRWYEVVTEYTRRQLTYSSDALPALSGVASKWSSKVSGRYFAGLWEFEFLRSLAWKTNGSGKRAYKEYVAPSWSWASIRKDIEFLKAGYQTISFVTINEIFCQPKGKDPFGQIADAYIVLSGIVLEGTLKGSKETTRGRSGFMEVDRVVNEVNLDSYEECTALIGKRVYFLRLFLDVMNEKTQRGFNRALVLDRESDDSNVYKRIGMMEYYSDDSWESHLAQKTIEEIKLV